MLEKWDEILKISPDNLNLWKEYLNFRQTHFLSFLYSDCLNVYKECINMVKIEAEDAKAGKMNNTHGFYKMFLSLLFLRRQTKTIRGNSRVYFYSVLPF